MGGIIMVILLIVLGIILIALFILNEESETIREDKEFRMSIFVSTILITFLISIISFLIYTPTIEDYLHGKVKIEVRQEYENGKVIKCDTIYHKLS